MVFAWFGTISQILCLLLVALLLLDISVRLKEFRKTSQKKHPFLWVLPKLEGGRGGRGRPCLNWSFHFLTVEFPQNQCKILLLISIWTIGKYSGYECVETYAIPLSNFTECQFRFNVNVYTNSHHFFCSSSQWYNDITWQGWIPIEKYDCELDFGQCQICNQVVLALSCNQCVFYGRAISCAVLHHLPHESSKPNLSEKIDLSTTRVPIPFSLWARADERMNECPRSIFFCI